MKIIEFYPLNDVNDREVGIEVEMEGNNLHFDGLSYWRITDDGSLRGESAEYVLKAPVKRQLAHARVDYLYRKLENISNIQPSDRCGVHIHINCQHLTFEQTYNFIILYLIFEDLLVHWCGEDREGNLFCLRASDAEYLIMSLISDKRNGIIRATANPDMFRYASMNLSALRKYGSIEFRALRTPKDGQVIKDWIDMLLAVKDKALSVENPIDFVSNCSLKGGLEFTRDVFGVELTKKLMCPDIDDVIMNGVRRVQALAYTPFGDTKAYVKRNGKVEDIQNGIRWAMFPNPPIPLRAVRADGEVIAGRARLDRIFAANDGE